MKVFVVMRYFWKDIWFCGIFETEEKAEDFILGQQAEGRFEIFEEVVQ